MRVGGEQGREEGGAGMSRSRGGGGTYERLWREWRAGVSCVCVAMKRDDFDFGGGGASGSALLAVSCMGGAGVSGKKAACAFIACACNAC